MFEHELRAQIEALHSEAAGAAFTDEQTTRWNDLNGELDEIETRRARLRELAGNPRHQEAAVPTEDAPVSRRRARASEVPSHLAETRSQALAAIDSHTGSLDPRSADQLEAIVEEDCAGDGSTSRYLAAVGGQHYASAFGKMLAEPQSAHLRWTPAEHLAVQRVNKVTSEQRALGIGSQGGNYPVPFELDPTVMLTSDGALNPIRQVARVVNIVGNHWTGVASAGVTAAYAAEGTEATDNSPTLTQPSADVEKASAFIPFSIETGEDWGALQTEMARLLQDARDVCESTQFLTGLGHGSNAPQGLLVGATAVVTTAATATFAIADVYSLLNAIPPRYLARTAVLASHTTFDRIYRFVGGGNLTEPPLLPTREGPVLGREKYAWSSMSTVTTTGSSIVAAGDFTAGYTILDRVGMSIELIPHLFGTARNYPTGQRGLYAYWRNTAVVTVPQAIRVLVVK